MRALVCDRPGAASLREVAAPEPGPGEVVVRVEAALTCGTDLKLYRRGHPKFPLPAILGHEFAGTVVAAGEGAPAPVGARVTAAVSGPCGACADCLAGRENVCATAFSAPLWGAFAERIRVPARVAARGLFRLPDGMPAATAALLDPLASVVRGLSRVPLDGARSLLVLGTGPIALMFAALALPRGLRVVVAGRRPHRLAAHAALGADTVLLDGGAPDAARGAVGEGGADVVVDTTGDARVASSAVDLAARGGTVLLFAGLARGVTIPVLAHRVHYDEVSVVGSFHYTPRQAREALELLQAGALPVEALVTDRRPLEEWEEVFASLEKGEGMKTAFVP